MVEAADILEELCRQLNTDTIMEPEGPSFTAFCKAADVRFDLPVSATVKERLLALMDMHAEFMPRKIIILCGIAPYLSREDWLTVMQYACYVKVTLLDIEAMLPEELYENEIRLTIDQDYTDMVKMG